jgi:hypothetical protein
MRAIATIFLGLILSACSMTAKDGTPITWEGPLPGDGSMVGTFKELSNPGSTFKQREAADTAKCRDLGFKPGSDAFANCRLQLDGARTVERRSMQSRRAKQDNELFQGGALTGTGGTTVYSASECVGPVIMGKCQGSIIPSGAYHPTCYGEFLNEQCTGPMF